MSAQIKHEFKQLITLLQDTWAERDAFRTICEKEIHRGVDLESVLEASKLRGHELFGSALSDIDKGAPVGSVVAELLDRLKTTI